MDYSGLLYSGETIYDKVLTNGEERECEIYFPTKSEQTNELWTITIVNED